MVLGTKKAIFPILFLGKMGPENVFYDLLEQKKNAFLGYKNRKIKKRKN